MQVWICSRAQLTPPTLPQHTAENLLTAATVDQYAVFLDLKLQCVIHSPLKEENKYCVQTGFPNTPLICHSPDWRIIYIFVPVHSSVSFYSIHSLKMKHLFNWKEKKKKCVILETSRTLWSEGNLRVYQTPIQMHGNANRYSSLDIIQSWHIKQSNFERATVSTLFREIKTHATHEQTEHANRLSD